MTDNERLKKMAKVIDLLTAIWSLHPELRFNQMMFWLNAEDSFYMTDEDFIEKIKERMEQ